MKNPSLLANGVDGPVRFEFGHSGNEIGQLPEKLVAMKVGIEQNSIGAQGRGDVGEAELQVHLLPGSERIG